MPRKVEVKSSYHIFRAASVPADGIHEWVIAAYKSWLIRNWSKFCNSIHNLAITSYSDYKKASRLRNQMSIGSGSRDLVRIHPKTSEWPRKREQPQHRQQYWFASKFSKGCTKFYTLDFETSLQLPQEFIQKQLSEEFLTFSQTLQADMTMSNVFLGSSIGFCFLLLLLVFTILFRIKSLVQLVTISLSF